MAENAPREPSPRLRRQPTETRVNEAGDSAEHSPIEPLTSRATTALRPRDVLALQQTVGNQAVQLMLAGRHQVLQTPSLAVADIMRGSVQRLTLQRWAEPASAQNVLRAMETADVDELRAMLSSLDVVPGSDAHVGVTLPGPTQAAIDQADATELRTRVADKLREKVMEALALARQPLVAQMTAAPTDAARHTAMAAVRASDAPPLAEIRRMSSGRANRWQHPNAAVQDAVLAAIQLEAVAGAEGYLASPATAHAASSTATGMDLDQEWCGMFAATNLMVSGLDRDLRAGFFHTSNVEHYFTYAYEGGAESRIKRWIYADAAWHDLHEYHVGLSSERKWTDARAIHAGALDFRSGDIALIDVTGSAAADHIVMVHSFDPATRMLFTIGGNDGGYVVDNNVAHPAPRAESPADRDRRLRDEAATGQSLRPGDAGGHVGIGSQDLTHQPDPNVVDRHPNAARPVRVFGIGRPSIVDFEDHHYDNTNPRHPPTNPPASTR